MTESESRAYEAGNYANAYTSNDLQEALERDEMKAQRFPLYPEGSPERNAYVAGFYSSYELHEIADLEDQMLVEAWRSEHESEEEKSVPLPGFTPKQA